MTSSQDKDSSKTSRPEQDDNPFIKFRRFADSQISSVLQGIIGLPSVFSTQKEDTRWGVLDERMKRRQEKIAGDEKKADNVDSSKVVYSYRVPPEYVASVSPEYDASSEDGRKDTDASRSEGVEYENLPLYSNFKDLAKIGPNLVNGSYGVSFRWIDYFEARPVQCANAIQSNLCKTLDSRWFCRDDFDLNRFWYGKKHSRSLLPFLLLSCNYSPLALTHMPRLRARGPGINPEGLPDDEFSYCDAFEDLLLASRGKPMRTWSLEGIRSISDIIFRSQDSLYPDLRFLRFNFPGDNASHSSYLGFSWLEGSLHKQGLLWEPPETGDNTKYSYAIEDEEKYRWGMEEPGEVKQSSAATSTDDSDDKPQTEQDMYNRFLNLATTAFERKPVKDLDFNSFLAEAEEIITKLIQEEENETTTSASQRPPSNDSKPVSADSQSRKHPTKFDTIRFNEMLNALVSILEEPSNPASLASDDQPNVPRCKPETVNTRWSTSSESATSSSPDRTYHYGYGQTLSETSTTSEDGTIHTTVVVRRQLPDGRIIRSQTDTVISNGQIVDSVTVEGEERVSDKGEAEWDRYEYGAESDPTQHRYKFGVPLDPTQHTAKQRRYNYGVPSHPRKYPAKQQEIMFRNKRLSDEQFVELPRKGNEKPGWFWDSERKRR